MKKTFMFLFACIIIASGMQAQTFLFEDFESVTLPDGWIRIDNDGDGHNWDPLIGFPGYSGSSSIASASYNGEPLTPDNWLITNAFTLTANATLTFYVAGYDPDYYQEHYSVYISTTGSDISDFTTELISGTTTSSTYEQKTVDLSAYTGQTVRLAFRHHDCTDQYWLRLDAVKVFAAPTEPIIEVRPQDINFGDVSFPGQHTTSFEVQGYMLTGNITATTSAPFSISSDGTSYGNSATLANTAGRFYVRYTPTTAGQSTGTITLSNPDASNTVVNVHGNAYDCTNTPLPYVFDFDDDEMAKCWSTIDVNHDATPGGYGEIVISTDYGYAVYGYSSVNNADDWLISPSFHLGERAVATFEHSATANMSGYVAPEKFEVYVIPDGQTYENATLVVPEQTTTDINWITQEVPLAAFAGQTLQVAIHVTSNANDFVWGVRHFTIANEVGVESHELTTSIYPNPTTGIFTIQCSQCPIDNIAVYDIYGKLMMNAEVNGNVATIDATSFSAGIYFAKIETANGVVTKRIVKK